VSCGAAGPTRAALAGVLAAALGTAGCAPAAPRPELVVAAAASLRDALIGLQPGIEGAADARVLFNFGASNDLARQILAAPHADLFLSADDLQVDRLEAEGLIEPGSRAVILSNRLAVVALAESSLRLSRPGDLASSGIERLAIADPGGVPAGRYAREWLVRAGVWDQVKDRIVPGVDVRAALAAVESGGAQAGVVYRTDAAISRRVKVLFEVGEGEGPPIRYVAAVIAGRPGAARARSALEFLRSAEARAVFERFGFLPAGR